MAVEVAVSEIDCTSERTRELAFGNLARRTRSLLVLVFVLVLVMPKVLRPRA